MNRYLEVLKNKGYKITRQRKEVLEILQECDKEHMNTDEILNRLAKSDKDVGVATVYRTLGMLVDVGLAYKLDLDGKSYRYELVDERHLQAHQHHHLICRACNKIIEVRGDFLDELEGIIDRQCGFQVTDHDVKFYGLCSSCRDHAKE